MRAIPSTTLAFPLTLVTLLTAAAAGCGEGEGIPVGRSGDGELGQPGFPSQPQPQPQPQDQPQPQPTPEEVGGPPVGQPPPAGGDDPATGEDDTPDLWVDDPPPPGGEDPPPGGMTVGTQVQAVFDGRCANAACHGVTRPLLTADEAYADLVGAPSLSCAGLPRVAPGDPDGSCLVLRVQDGRFGAQMPLGGAALAAEGIEAIRTWILRLPPAE